MVKSNRTSGRVINSKRFCILLGYYTSARQWHGNPVDGEMTRGPTTVYGRYIMIYIYIYTYTHIIYIYIYIYMIYLGTTSRIIISSYHLCLKAKSPPKKRATATGFWGGHPEGVSPWRTWGYLGIPGKLGKWLRIGENGHGNSDL